MNDSATDRKKDTFFTGIDLIGERKQKQRAVPSAKRPMSSVVPPRSKAAVDSSRQEEPKKGNYRKRLNLYDIILFQPPYERYYERVNEAYNITPPITPGINFIKRIFSHEHAEKAILHLKLNMPETYWNDTEMFYIYNDLNNYSALTMIKNKKDFDLFDTLERIERVQYKRELKGIDPFIVIRNRDSDYENSVKVERYEKAQDNLGKDIGDGLVQRYIRCKGRNRELDKITVPSRKNFVRKTTRKSSNAQDNSASPQLETEGSSPGTIKQTKPLSGTGNESTQEIFSEKVRKSYSKPAIIRLEYKTGHNREKGCNVAYALVNKAFVEPSIQPATKDILERYSQLTTINTADRNSYFIYVMSGDSVQPYEFYAKQIVTYVQRWFKLLLRTIVIDFIKDERGIIYFLGVKAFKPLKDPPEEGDIVYQTHLNKPNEEDNIRKFYKTWTCRLCLLPYPKSKITKIVTFKLLYKLKENLKKRGFHHFEHINNNIYNESQSCRVCDLCYTLLVTEQELMEIQKTIALCNNIEIQNDELLSSASQSPEGLVRAPQKFKQLVQWRIMFYFKNFYNFDYSRFPFEDGSQVPITATPQEKKRAKTNYKLYITLFGQKVSVPIFTEMKQFKTKDEVEINKSKIFYFFSTESSNIKQILRNEEVDFRIVLNDKFKEPLASIKTTCFSYYDDNVKEKPMTSRTVLNFFSDYIAHFKCQAHIGLKCDGLVQTENLQMYCYKLPNPIYITDLDYYSYHTLPNDWYELYIPPDTKIEDDTNYEIEKMIDGIINKLEGKEKKKKEINDDEVYDPYDQLVMIQNKNDIINKIESIPIVVDKSFIEMKQEEKKERPKTSKLYAKYDFRDIDKKYGDKKKKDFRFGYGMKYDKEAEKKRIAEEKQKAEEEKKKAEEEKKMIKELDHHEFDDFMDNTDKLFDKLASKNQKDELH